MKNIKKIIKNSLLKSFFSNTFKEYILLKEKSGEVDKHKEILEEQKKQFLKMEYNYNAVLKEQKQQFENSEDNYKKAEVELRQYTQTVERMYWESENQLININKTLSLIKAYNEKGLDEVSIEKYTYTNLYKCIDLSGDLFKKISSMVYKININSIKKKGKIKISFLAVTASTWSCDSLYKKLINDEKFEINIIITPFQNGSPSTIYEIYTQTKDFFDNRGYKSIGIYDKQTNKYLTFEEAGSPDILFHLNPHTCCIPENFKIENIPLKVLNIYIPYGVMTFGMTDIQYNQMSHHLFWKIFCESELHKEMSNKYSMIGDINVEISGYLKMDAFLDGSLPDIASNIWKIAEGEIDLSKVIKIIYAPHHTLGENKHSFSTFSKNCREILQYAKGHPNTSWIYKPHPLLKQACVKNGLFKDEEEYDCYVEEWKNLSNARVVTEESYIDIFKTSDGIILDSVSFLSEYLYVNKPILLLTRDTQTFNDYGIELKEVLYKVDGKDIEGVFNFIEDILINDNDTMKNAREEFYERYLNYFKINKGLLASDYIYNYLKACLKSI